MVVVAIFTSVRLQKLIANITLSRVKINLLLNSSNLQTFLLFKFLFLFLLNLQTQNINSKAEQKLTFQKVSTKITCI